MGVRATSPSRVSVSFWWFLLAGGLLLAAVPLSLLQLNRDGPPPAGILRDGPRIAYLEFAPRADALWLVDPQQPSARVKLLDLPHAPEFGVVPSLAPDGRSFAYTALSASIRAPSTGAPAELWLADVREESTPVLIATNVDLPVPVRWSPDGNTLVFRRSHAVPQTSAGGSRLVFLDRNTSEERELVSTESAALFPIAFSPEGADLYFVRLTQGASELAAVDVASGRQREVANLAMGLTRDWTLSPDGRRLAYLAMDLTESRVSARALVLDLTTGSIEPSGATDLDAVGPVWTNSGELVVGQAGQNRSAATDGIRTWQPPARGFDVPLAFEPADGILAVRSFEGPSVMAPGRSVIAVLNQDGSRNTIASGEVTFLGWINP